MADWEEVEGTFGKTVYFVVYDCDGDPLNLTGYANKTLKVWRDDIKTIKFSGAMVDVAPALGQLKYILQAGDIDDGDRGTWFWAIELENTAGLPAVVTDALLTKRGSLRILPGPLP